MLSSTQAKIAIVALAGGLVLAGLALAPVFAGDTKPRTETVEIRKVIHDGPGNTANAAVMAKCDGETVEISSDAAASPDRKDVAKIKLCLKAGTKVETAARLEEVVADLDQQGEMSASVKADLKAKLTAKAAELRAAN